MTIKERLRLDKVLSHMGIGSRREIKSLVKANRVLVNDIPAQFADMHIQVSQDRITVDGRPIIYQKYVYYMLNKPAGILSATEDKYEDVVLDLLLPEHRSFHPFPVGRLDKDTEGLLLLTNDGKLAHELLSPKKHVAKTYYAEVLGEVTTEDSLAFQRGVTLDDGYQTMPAQLAILHSGAESTVEISIYEGKFHQVKRMFAAVGKKVTYLKRLSMGPLCLDPTLSRGDYRQLYGEEIRKLQEKICKNTGD